MHAFLGCKRIPSEGAQTSFEPDILRLGKAFELEVREGGLAVGDGDGSWHELVPSKGSGRGLWDAQRQVWDHPATRRRGRRGFIDLLITFEDPETGLPAKVVVEIKNTRWDELRSPRQTISRHKTQAWSYLEPLTEQLDRGELSFLQVWTVYPERPADQVLLQSIEESLGQFGVSVLWYEDIRSDGCRWLPEWMHSSMAFAWGMAPIRHLVKGRLGREGLGS